MVQDFAQVGFYHCKSIIIAQCFGRFGNSVRLMRLWMKLWPAFHLVYAWFPFSAWSCGSILWKLWIVCMMRVGLEHGGCCLQIISHVLMRLQLWS
ncbi:unnamed protein product [Lathyrus sativus]|nr:unnamed protein product [Lathyrus sativus]